MINYLNKLFDCNFFRTVIFYMLLSNVIGLLFFWGVGGGDKSIVFLIISVLLILSTIVSLPIHIFILVQSDVSGESPIAYPVFLLSFALVFLIIYLFIRRLSEKNQQRITDYFLFGDNIYIKILLNVLFLAMLIAMIIIPAIWPIDFV